MDAAVDGLAALSVSDDDSWETPRGVESWVATPRGGFALSPAKLPPLPGENSSSAANVIGKKPSIAEIKAAGRAKVKAQQEAVAAEVEEQSRASSLWSAAFDYTFDPRQTRTPSSPISSSTASGCSCLCRASPRGSA